MKESVYLLADVPEENKFYLKNGKVLRNMKELAQEFEEMDDDTFSHHVNDSRNDFSNWVGTTIGDHVLANAIGQVKDKTAIKKHVKKRVAQLEGIYKSAKARKKN